MFKKLLIPIILVIALTTSAWADQKVTQLAAETDPAADDLLYLVTDVSTTPLSKKVSLTTLFGNIPVNVTLDTGKHFGIGSRQWDDGSDYIDIDATNPADVTAFAKTILDDADEATFKATVNLEVGTDVQAYDAELAALAGLTSAANKIPYFTGSETAGLLDFKDEDTMSSDSETAVPSQQSTKAYVDAGLATKAGTTHASQHTPDGADPYNDWNWAGDITVAAGVATVAQGYIYHTSNLSTTTITDFQCSGGGTACLTTGESRIRIFMNDGDVTIDFSANANIEGNAGVDYTGSASDTTIVEFLFVNNGTIKWQSVNLNSGFSNALTLSAKIGALTPVADDADNFASVFTTYNFYGGTFRTTADGTAALPNATAGYHFTITDAGGTPTIEPLATGTDDTIYLNETTCGQGKYIISDGTTGNMAFFQYLTADTWTVQAVGFTCEP